jgi:diacylglycerol kinase (ATP)
MQKIAVFYNQHASGSNKSIWVEKVKEILFRSELTFYPILGPVQMKADVDELVASGTNIVVCIGGDGSVNLIIQYLAHSNISLLVIPAGTANDLARELGVVRRITESIAAVRLNHFKPIDLLEVGGRYFATSGGFGIGGNVTHIINDLRKKVDPFKYVLRLLKHRVYSAVLLYHSLLRTLTFHHVKIDSKEFSGEVRTAFTLITNQSKIAGDVELSSGATNNDGKFTVFCLAYDNKLDLIKSFYQVLTGNPPESDPNFILFETDKVSVATIDGTTMSFFGDGEVFGEYQEFVVQMHHEALNVYIVDEESCGKTA